MNLSVDQASVQLWGADQSAQLYRWGSATWGGQTAWWGGDRWNAIDCQVTEAAIRWGCDDTSGVLAQSAAGQLAASTYDPDGLLDPANPASGYQAAGMLLPGTPYRITHAGNALRTGRLSEATYDRATGEGRLEGRDPIAELAASSTAPTFRATANSLRAFAAQVIASAQLSIPVESSSDPDPVIAWRNRTDSQNAWGLIRDAAFDALHLAFTDGAGFLCFEPFGSPTPLDRGIVIGDGGICLEGLETGSTDEGIYTDVTDAAGPLRVSGLAQPRIVSVDRREPAGASWALSIASDRQAGAVQYAPSLIRPDDLTELNQLATMRGCERVRLKLDTPPAINVRGKVLGGSLRAPAGGDWSAGLVMYVPPVPWSYVPPTPAAVTGTPVARTLVSVADTEIALAYNANPGYAKAMATGAGGDGADLTICGGTPAAGTPGDSKSRGLLRFDLSDEALWSGVRIYRSAVLRLYVVLVNNGGPATLIVDRILEQWAEGYSPGRLEFNNNGVIWPGPAVTSSGEVSAAGPTAAGGYWSIDVTEIVRAWIPRSLGGDALPNFGLQIRTADETSLGRAIFRDKRVAGAGNPPQLIINGEG